MILVGAVAGGQIHALLLVSALRLLGVTRSPDLSTAL